MPFEFLRRRGSSPLAGHPSGPPTCHRAGLIVAVSLWLASVCNLPLWWALANLPAVEGARGLGFALAFMVLIAAGNTAVIALIDVLTWGRGLKAVLALFVVTAAAGAYFMASYGIVIDTSMLVNVLQTDPGEAADLLNWRMAAALILLAGPPLWWMGRQSVRPLGRWRRLAHGGALLVTAVLVAVASLLLVFQDFAATMRNHKQLRYLINPLNSLYAVGDLAAQPLRMDSKTLAALGRDAQLGPSYAGQSSAPLLVLVVGETARAANFGLNGYARETTPQLSARSDIANAPNAWACGTSTAASLPCMFSHLGRSGFEGRRTNYENLLDILGHAGLGVVWIDNQSGCKGVCARVPEIPTKNLTDPQWCAAGECQDPVMLTVLSAQIDALPAAQRTRASVLVLHQMGSHGPAYAKRSLAEQKKFFPECQTNALQQCSQQEVVNAYDNSILATDDFLQRTIDWLQARGGPSALLYVSDHGESLGENNLYLHGLPYAIAPDTQKHIPWIAWLSPQMQSRTGIATACLAQRWASERLSHDHYLHSVLGLMDVRTSVYQPSLDAFAPCKG